MTESPEYRELAGDDPEYIEDLEEDPQEPPEDFELDDEDEHAKEDVGGPGGIINYNAETWPEGWAYVEGESSPPVEDL